MMQDRRPDGRVLWICLSPALIVSIFHVTITSPLVDLFHEGEYLAPRLLVDSGTPPLLIHGFMDYVPAQLAAWIFGNDHVIAGCRLINLVLVFFGTVAFIGMVFEISKDTNFRSVSLLLGALIVTYYDGSLPNALTIQQGSPGLRDTFLLLEMALITLSLSRTRRARDLFSFSAGFVGALGLFWCYNRGVIGILLILILSIANRIKTDSWTTTSIPIGGCAVGLFVYALVNHHWISEVENIIYWYQNESIWNYAAPSVSTYEWYASIIFPTVAIVASLIVTIAHRTKAKSNGITIAIMLMLISAVVLEQQVHRNDFPHQMFIRPWLYLMVLQVFTLAASAYPTLKLSLTLEWSTLALVAIVSIIECARPAATPTTPGSHLFETLQGAFTGLPSDSSLLPLETQRIVKALQRQSPRCTYVLNNGGALYGASGLKPCSSIFLPVYASKESQYRVMSDLRESHPKIIVGFSKSWWSSMHGKPLSQRTPELSSWLSSHYGRRFYVGSTELRIRSF
jgi:hypothetical protein